MSVDHRIPRSAGGTDDDTNLQALCGPHHARKSAREAHAARFAPAIAPTRAPLRGRTVVCGPPGAGKSTYVRRHRQPGDIVWDWDLVAEVTIVGRTRHDIPKELNAVIRGMRSGLIDALTTDVPFVRAWIIVGRLAVAEQIAAAVGAELVVMATPEKICVDRGIGRPDRVREVRRWWREWARRCPSWTGRVEVGA